MNGLWYGTGADKKIIALFAIYGSFGVGGGKSGRKWEWVVEISPTNPNLWEQWK